MPVHHARGIRGRGPHLQWTPPTSLVPWTNPTRCTVSATAQSERKKQQRERESSRPVLFHSSHLSLLPSHGRRLRTLALSLSLAPHPDLRRRRQGWKAAGLSATTAGGAEVRQGPPRERPGWCCSFAGVPQSPDLRPFPPSLAPPATAASSSPAPGGGAGRNKLPPKSPSISSFHSSPTSSRLAGLGGLIDPRRILPRPRLAHRPR